MFLKTIQQLRQGNLMDELDDQLASLVRQVKATARPGEIVLKLKVRPLTESGSAVQVEDLVTTKEPALPREKTVMFPTDTGELLREDPRQKKLDLKAVPESHGPLKEVVDKSTGEIKTVAA